MLSELESATGLKKSSLSRHYHVLTRVGIIEHEPDKKGFGVGVNANKYLSAWGLPVVDGPVEEEERA